MHSNSGERKCNLKACNLDFFSLPHVSKHCRDYKVKRHRLSDLFQSATWAHNNVKF
jgi:hypothetical protein